MLPQAAVADFSTDLICDDSFLYQNKVVLNHRLAGEGTTDSPYLIQSLEDLLRFRASVNSGYDFGGKTVKLAVDIDLSGENPWTPIGVMGSGIDNTPTRYFNGTFDGGDHTIDALVIQDADADYQGFFAYCYPDSVIKNVHFTNTSIQARYRVGAVCGYSSGGMIENCTVSGSVSGESYVGGICGDGENIEGCVSNATVTGTDECIGGIVGDAAGELKNCANFGSV